MAMSKYIDFKLLEEKPRTQVWGIYSKSQNIRLGIIKWWGPWRQYTFLPDDRTLYSSGCLSDIIAFIRKLMDERKNKEAIFE